MKFTSIVWKELRERPTAMFTSVLAILLGVTALVAIRNVTVFSEQEVAGKLEALGANVLILPKGVTLQDYYAADMHEETIPEEHVAELAMAGLTGVEGLSPKLCVPISLGDKKATLTGILPQAELQAMAVWQGGRLFKKHVGCKAKINVANATDDAPEALARKRTIQDLGENDVVIGAEVATSSGLKTGDSVELLGESFTVIAALEPTGTIDDSRIFAHLHTVQRISGAGEVVNVIEVMGCCEDVANGLVGQLGDMLPDTKVITIANVVETQVSINRMMSSLSYLFLAILIAVGGASMASAMYANVMERRREIGTLMALGATPRFVTQLFLFKAGILGLVGGIGGYIVGSGLALILGPTFAGVAVQPIPSLALVAAGTAMVVSFAASYFPARRAAGLDPCLCFQEV